MGTATATYQWQYKAAGAWTNIAGETGHSLAAGAFNVVQTTEFRRVAYSSYLGIVCDVTDDPPFTSNTVTVIVEPVRNLAISTPGLTICSSESLVYTGQGWVVGDTFRWFRDDVVIAGETSSIYTSAPGVDTNGDKITFETNTGGDGTCINTVDVTVNVDANPPASITTTGTIICSGSTATYTAEPSGSGETYIFTLGGVTQSNGVASATIVGNVFTTTAIISNTTVGVTVTNASGCSATTTRSVVVPLVTTAGSITAPSDLTICVGEDQPALPSAATASVSLMGMGTATATYQWQYKAAGAWTNIAGETGHSLAAGAFNVVQTTEFRRVAYSSYLGIVCDVTDDPPFTSNTVTVIVEPVRNLAISTPGLTICSSESLVYTGQGWVVGDTFRWFRDDVVIAGETSSIYTSAPGVDTNGDKITFETNTGGDGTCINTVDVTVNVDANPPASITTTGTIICSGSTATYTAEPSGSGETYIFTLGGVTQSNGVASATIVGNVFTTTAIISNTTVGVTVTNASGCSATTTRSVVVPLVTTAGSITAPSDLTICVGEDQPALPSAATASVSLMGMGTATATYQWQYKAAGAWTNIAGETGHSLAAGAFNVVQTTEFRRVAYSSYLGIVCDVTDDPPFTSNTVTVIVEPVRNLAISTPGLTICSSESLVYTGQGWVVGDTFRWFRDDVVIAGETSSIYTSAPGVDTNGDKITFETNTGGDGTCINTVDVTVNVDANPPASITTTGTIICSGSTATYTAEPSGSGETYIFTLGGVTQSNGVASATIVGNVFTTTAIISNTTVGVTVTNASGCSATTTRSVVVPLVTTAGSITAPSDLTICVGEDQPALPSAATASVSLMGMGTATATYQWQYKAAGAWTNIAGETGHSLAAGAFNVVQTTEFRRVAYSSYLGIVCDVTDDPPFTSNTVTVIVEPVRNLAISTPGLTICSSESLVYTGQGWVVGDTFRWFRDDVVIAGETSSIYTSAPGVDTNGDKITFETNTGGDGTCINTVDVTVNVDANPPASITTTGTIICSGSTATYTAEPSGSGETYIFTLGGVTQSNGVASATIVGNVFTTTAIISNTTVGVTVTNASGCSATTTRSVVVPLVTTAGSITAPSDLTICVGEDQPALPSAATASVSLMGMGTATATYQWQYKAAGAWTNIAGETGHSLAAGAFNVVQTTEFRRVAYSSYLGIVCDVTDDPPFTSNTVTVIVEPVRNLAISTPGLTICSSESLVYTGQGWVVGDTFRWFRDDVVIAGETSSIYTSAPGVDTNGDKITFETNTGGDGTCINTVDVTVNVDANPPASITTTGTIICSGSTATYTAEPSGSGETYIFTLGGVTQSNGVASATIVGNVFTTTAIISNTTVGVTVTNASGCSATTTRSVVVPLVTTAGSITAPSDLTICVGEDQPALPSAATASVSLMGMGTATATYQWQYKAAGAWTNIAGETGHSLAAGAFNVVQTTEFRRVAYSSYLGIVCDVTDDPPFTSNTVTVIVEPVRNLAISTPGLTICSSESLTYTGQGWVVGDTFRWFRDDVVIAGETSSIYTSAPGVDTNGDKITFETNTGGDGTCINTVDVTVNVDANPIAFIQTNVPGNIICGGDPGGAPFADTVLFTAFARDAFGATIAGASFQFFRGDGSILSGNVVGGNTLFNRRFFYY